ncbi:putative bifunctional diguanylate cyclase/phosphodiesterase [Allorhizocola rhizosphaerae]|uniref:putative bifunctional diguanylate cyclase/phosphodiesterase n=1 Tax=Allorhizocola rhizosphaerae TaxID=1872709 RepID=UPI0013C32F8E|nr:EAL domain-containing protein [Allorhizocola rhizosphaerae]
MSQAAPTSMAPTAFKLSGLCLALGAAAAGVYVAASDTMLAAAVFVLVGLGSGVAILYGMRLYRPVPAWPWACLSAACGAFVGGAVLRGWVQDSAGTSSLLGDSFTIPGYVLMFLGLGGFLASRTGARKHALIDGLLVAVGAGLVFTLLLAVPAASIGGRPPVVSALAGIYPMLDSVLVLLVLNLAFSTARRGPAYYLLMCCMALMLTGDVAYAVIGTTGELTGSPLLDLPFLLGFCAVAAGALHPSMVDLGGRADLPVQAWSVPRLLLIAPALAAPFVLAVLIRQPSLVDRAVLATGGLLVVALLLIRAVSAVQGYVAAQHQYEYQATHDPLTGLANRALWFAQVRSMLAQPAPPGVHVWVFFLDLDGFKLVNDSRGHGAGDEVISEVARRLSACVPPGAAIARVGGDEFALACQARHDEAIEVAEEVLRTLRQTLRMPTLNVAISASIGIATSANMAGGATAEDLLRDADTAMYQAKAAGRDTWVIFDPVMRERVRERIETDLALREALETHQFELAFQPIVRLSTGRPVGAEALIRWLHPERGMVLPTSFIPVAEESGLIIDIGRWVIHAALRQLAQWREAGTVDHGFSMSINVSARQLHDPRLPADLGAALAQYRVPPSVVTVELTESVMIDATSGADQVMNNLRELGVQLVVDDFGTGFSALGYLRKYPVTGVKIDRSFVAGLGSNTEDEAIVRAVVAMSTALHLGVVAEGVHDERQRDVLEALGVRYGQGWLWGRPATADAFETMVAPTITA